MTNTGLEPQRTGTSSARLVARSLSGYLCGTHSGWLAAKQGDRLGPDEIGPAHRAQERPERLDELTWATPWEPAAAFAGLAARLGRVLRHPAVIDLLVYGSHARGVPTGFSDLDAVLVIEDRAAEDAAALRSLRRQVLAAQRVVLSHQSMQHHGFEVATPKLLANADVSLGLPRESLQEARSLFGRTLTGAFSREPPAPAIRLAAMTAQLEELPAWPRHPWKLHVAVSMFELLPALYLQATGVAVSKARSFALARERLVGEWWAYDVLEEVRAVWPRRRHRGLDLTASAARNPWVAVAAWTRLPARRPPAVGPLLSARCLAGLQQLARRMAEETR